MGSSCDLRHANLARFVRSFPSLRRAAAAAAAVGWSRLFLLAQCCRIGGLVPCFVFVAKQNGARACKSFVFLVCVRQTGRQRKNNKPMMFVYLNPRCLPPVVMPHKNQAKIVCIPERKCCLSCCVFCVWCPLPFSDYWGIFGLLLGDPASFYTSRKCPTAVGCCPSTLQTNRPRQRERDRDRDELQRETVLWGCVSLAAFLSPFKAPVGAGCRSGFVLFFRLSAACTHAGKWPSMLIILPFNLKSKAVSNVRQTTNLFTADMHGLALPT